MIAIDFDIGTARAEPHVPLVSQTVGWINAAFAAGGANPVTGARLRPLLRAAGLRDVTTFGIQRYLAPEDPTGPALIAGVVRSLAPKILADGIASDADLGLGTLGQGLADAIKATDAVVPGSRFSRRVGRRDGLTLAGPHAPRPAKNECDPGGEGRTDAMDHRSRMPGGGLRRSKPGAGDSVALES